MVVMKDVTIMLVLLIGFVGVPVTADDEPVPIDPLDDNCTGLKRFGVQAFLSPYPPNSVAPHQGVVVHTYSTTTALFILEDGQSHYDSMDGGSADNVIWYIMSGTTGFAGRCEDVVCPQKMGHVASPSSLVVDVQSFVELVDSVKQAGCLA